MRYTGPKFKLCRREGINLFGTPKYDVRKRRTLPGQHGGTMARLSEYGKLLRNKQVLKRIYQMSEKQFKRFVTDVAAKYSKNNNVDYDKAVKITLERRLDAVLLRS
jgi:small subunit ribosomal protein S4